jgi:hypothetical protein
MCSAEARRVGESAASSCELPQARASGVIVAVGKTFVEELAFIEVRQGEVVAVLEIDRLQVQAYVDEEGKAHQSVTGRRG